MTVTQNDVLTRLVNTTMLGTAIEPAGDTHLILARAKLLAMKNLFCISCQVAMCAV